MDSGDVTGRQGFVEGLCHRFVSAFLRDFLGVCQLLHVLMCIEIQMILVDAVVIYNYLEAAFGVYIGAEGRCCYMGKCAG